MNNAQPDSTFSTRTGVLIPTIAAVVRGLRPAQWLKNGLVFAGLVYGGKLLDPDAVARAIAAALVFCVISGGFYLVNDVRDMAADRLHPAKRSRPVAAGDLAPSTALGTGLVLIGLAFIAAAALGTSFLLVMLAYGGLIAAYNLGLKQIVILDVFTIAAGFVLRAAGGAVAVDVLISPWLLVVTMLLALLIGFGKRRYELLSLPDAARHRRNLEVYSRPMLDQAVGLSAAGTLLAYAIYALDANNVVQDPRFMLTIPIVAYGIFRYLLVLYQHDQGGAPETLLLTDRPLLAAVMLWALTSAALLYLPL